MAARCALAITAHMSARRQSGRAVYHGAIQLLLEPTGRKMTGKWVGFGRDFDLNTGPWTLELITSTVTEETLKEYSKPAGGE